MPFPTAALDATDILAEPSRLDPLPPLLTANGLTLLHGPSGSGKSWLALRLAWAVATGRPVFGWIPPAPGRVIYIDGQHAHADLAERLTAIATAADGGEPPAPGYLRLLPLRGVGAADKHVRLDAEDGLARLAEMAAGAALVVIDDLASVAGPGSGDSGHGRRALLKRLALERRLGGWAMLSTHASTGRGLPRGFGADRSGIDTLARLCRPDEDDKGRSPARFVVPDALRDRLAIDAATDAGLAVDLHLEQRPRRRTHHAGALRIALRATTRGLSWSHAAIEPAPRWRAEAMFESGASVRATAAALGVPVSTAGLWRRHWAAARGDGPLPARPERPLRRQPRTVDVAEWTAPTPRDGRSAPERAAALRSA